MEQPSLIGEAIACFNPMGRRTRIWLSFSLFHPGGSVWACWPWSLGNASPSTVTSLIGARSGRVIAVATEGDATIGGLMEQVIAIPPAPELLSSLIEIVPLQLLAYYLAVRRGADVDQPRNLAKGVTVE